MQVEALIAIVPPQVKVADGRVMVGNLSCYDQQGNIILSNTLEYVETRRVR